MEEESLPSESYGSLKSGLWLVFQDKNSNVIRYWGSSYSGKEKIFINDSLLVEQRNWKLKKETTFNSNDGTEYKLEYKVHKLKELEFKLFNEASLIDHKIVKVSFIKSNKKYLKSILLWFSGLFFFTLTILLFAKFMIIKYQWPEIIDEVLAILCGVIFMFFFLRSRINYSRNYQIINLLEE